MSATAAWCAVQDMLQEAPTLEPGRMVSGMRERVAFLEDKLREEVERRLALEAELLEWTGQDEGVQTPESMAEQFKELLGGLGDAKDARNKAFIERDSARYVVETAGDRLSKGDVIGALVILQANIASYPYEKDSQQQDTLKRIAALLDPKTMPIWLLPVGAVVPGSGHPQAKPARNATRKAKR